MNEDAFKSVVLVAVLMSSCLFLYHSAPYFNLLLGLALSIACEIKPDNTSKVQNGRLNVHTIQSYCLVLRAHQPTRSLLCHYTSFKFILEGLSKYIIHPGNR